MSEDVARLGYEIDSSQALNAADNLSKMSAAAERSARSMSVSQREGAKQSRSLDQVVRAAQKSQRQIDRLAKAQRQGQITGAQFTGELNKIAASLRAMGMDRAQSEVMQYARATSEAERAQGELSRAVASSSAVLSTEAAALDASSAALNRRAGAMGAARANTTNLMFQVQDIGMMTAAMQNPLMLAMQQGTQVTGVFHQMRQAGQRIGPAIASSLGAMINPMSLVTLGAIAGGAALVQWGIKALGAADDAMTFEERLDELNESLSTAEDGLGGMGDALGNLISLGGNYSDAAQEIARLNRELATMEATSGLSDTVDTLNDANPLLRDFRRGLVAVRDAQAELAAFQSSGVVPDWLSGSTFEALSDQDVIGRITQRIDQFGDALDATAAQMGMSEVEARRLSAALDQIESAQNIQAQADAARELRETFLATAGNARQLTEEEQEFLATLIQVEQVALRIQAIEQNRAAAVEESAQSIERQLELEQLALRYGEDSLEVMRQRHDWEEADLRLRLQSLGATAPQIDRQIEMLRNQQEIVEQTRQAVELMERLGSQELDVVGQINALADALSISNARAATLLARLGMISAPGRTTGIIGPEPGRGGPTPPPPASTGAPSSPSGGGGAGGGGAGGGINPQSALSALERLLGQFTDDPYAEATAWYNEALEALSDAQLIERGMMEEHNAYRLQIEQTYAQQLAEIEQQSRDRRISELGGFFGAMASVAQAGGERMNRVARTLAATEGLINTYLAATQTLRDPTLGFFGKMAAYAKVLAAGMKLVQGIKNAGGGGGGGASSGAANAAVPAAAPERVIRVDFDGPDWARDMFQSFQDQLYENSRDGTRVIFAR